MTNSEARIVGGTTNIVLKITKMARGFMTKSITEFLAAGQFTPCWSTANCDVFLTIARGPCFNCTPHQSIEWQIKPESERSLVRIGDRGCRNTKLQQPFYQLLNYQLTK